LEDGEATKFWMALDGSQLGADLPDKGLTDKCENHRCTVLGMKMKLGTSPQTIT